MNDERGEGFLDKIKGALGMGDERGSDTSASATDRAWSEQEGTGGATGTTMDSGEGGWSEGTGEQAGYQGDRETTLTGSTSGSSEWASGGSSSGSMAGSSSLDTDEDVIHDGRQERGS